MTRYKHIDLSLLQEITGGDSLKLQKYIKLFLEEAPRHLGRIKLEVTKRDWPAVKKAVHTFKPQIKYIGIHTLDPVIKKIEYNSSNQTGLDMIPGLIDTVEEICEEAMEELRMSIT